MFSKDNHFGDGGTQSPDLLMCGPVAYAAFKAMDEFKERDWRRVKREVNKAVRSARAKTVMVGADFIQAKAV